MSGTLLEPPLFEGRWRISLTSWFSSWLLLLSCPLGDRAKSDKEPLFGSATQASVWALSCPLVNSINPKIYGVRPREWPRSATETTRLHGLSVLFIRLTRFFFGLSVIPSLFISSYVPVSCFSSLWVVSFCFLPSLNTLQKLLRLHPTASAVCRPNLINPKRPC